MLSVMRGGVERPYFKNSAGTEVLERAKHHLSLRGFCVTFTSMASSSILVQWIEMEEGDQHDLKITMTAMAC